MKFPRRDFWLHSIMCVTGGFLGAYALLCRDYNFGNAQTVNLIQLFTCVLGRNFFEFFLRFLGFVLYVGAILIYIYLDKKTEINLERYAILVNLAGVVLLAFLPQNINPVVGILPIFFMMSTQWSVFHGIGEYNSSTIFSTNNIRQCTLGFGNYLISKDKKSLEKGKFFGNSLLWYHLGVVLSFFSCRYFGVKASLCAIPIVIIALCLTFQTEHSYIAKKKIIKAKA